MASLLKDIYDGELPTVEGDLLTAGAAPADGSARLIFTFTIANNTAAAVTVALKKGTAGAEKNILPTGFTIPANDAYVHAKNEYLAGLGKIRGVASVAGVHIHIGGIENS